jgi:hypothetical protein
MTAQTREKRGEAATPRGNGQRPAAERPPSEVLDPEVPEKPTRRRFTAQYTLRVLNEADAGGEPGAMGALLRREGRSASHLTTWRRQREQGALWALAPRKRGRRPVPREPWKDRVAFRERESEELRKRLTQAEQRIEVQKKIAELLGNSTQGQPRTGNR